MNYYNENEPKAAAWIRQLIEDKLIPPGEVDDRSIKEVTAQDVKGYTQCHWFAGIAGWSLALQIAGWPASRRIWTASCPCQPFSSAGKQMGRKDPRHLWPTLRRLINECAPTACIGEQSASKGGRKWLAGVCNNLETMGYATAAVDISAPCVCAPHIRQRLYWVADAQCGGRQGWTVPGGGPDAVLATADGLSGGLADADGRHTSAEREQRRREQRFLEAYGGLDGLADASGMPRSEQRDQPRQGPRRGAPQDDAAEHTGPVRVADADQQHWSERYGYAPRREGSADGSADSGVADTNQFNGDGAGLGAGHDSGKWEGSGGLQGQPHHPGHHWLNFDTIRCTDGKARRIESGVLPLAHGLPGRVGLIRGYGNAIVPPLAAEFIKAFMKTKK